LPVEYLDEPFQNYIENFISEDPIKPSKKSYIENRKPASHLEKKSKKIKKTIEA